MVVHHNRNQSIRIAPESKSGHYGVYLDAPEDRESRRKASGMLSTRGPSARGSPMTVMDRTASLTQRTQRIDRAQ
jgi:hypothetical protein